jgi:hypothetical protein
MRGHFFKKNEKKARKKIKKEFIPHVDDLDGSIYERYSRKIKENLLHAFLDSSKNSRLLCPQRKMNSDDPSRYRAQWLNPLPGIKGTNTLSRERERERERERDKQCG